MIRPGWKFAFGIVVFAVCLAAPSRTEAVPYYTATYVGMSQDIGNSAPNAGVIVNRTTGEAFPFQSTWIDPHSQPAGFFDSLPTTRVYQGALEPILTTYTMLPSAMNSSGVVLGTIAVSRSIHPEGDPAVGYTVRQANGYFGMFIQLAHDHSHYYGVPQLSETGQILIRLANGGPTLVDTTTGIATQVRDLIPPELLAKYGGILDATSIDDRGDILVQIYNGSGISSEFILTPPGLAAPSPVPEPSILYLAAATIAGLTVRSRRRSG
ncbi:hypothetical protein [Paludisphaera rhizosphaerae]|uniref:hypothetical protein n=1 Tax=Paludisphaera rhizosphaerae TaxID=2711216 RepID=UPI0013EC66A0|nr:hypothetical protein [Paludisphaera rhizosphaerae]